MANAANSPFVKHPALLALFGPRPPPPFKQPMPKKPMPKLSGIAAYTEQFAHCEDLPEPIKYETPTERKERLRKEKQDRHLQILSEREKEWDPHNNENATKDPFKTLFVARLSYELTEDDLRREFERYGRIRDIKLILDNKTQKSRGYAFIEFERSNDLKEAFQHADGHKLKGRRILVDVERGRTVKNWKPRKLGGGLGKTRIGPNNDKTKDSTNSIAEKSSRSSRKASSTRGDRHRSSKKDSTSKYSSRRDKYRDRDYRDRDRRSGRDRKDTDRSGKSERERTRRSRSRSRDKKDRTKRRDREKKEGKDRGDRTRNDRGYENKGERTNGRKDRENKEKDRSRRRRSRSKEKTRRR